MLLSWTFKEMLGRNRLKLKPSDFIRGLFNWAGSCYALRYCTNTMLELSSTIWIAVFFLFVMEGIMFLFLWKTNKRIAKFFSNTGDKSMEKVLERELKKMKKTEEDIKLLVENMKWIEGVSRRGVSKVGITRYNPFKDIGGEQSFSIAMLDNAGSGVIMSSLHAGEGTRVYAKPVMEGASSYQLTEEEKQTIEKAMA
jgi:uncharacterized protein YjeT (DUF2065 family)